jgi:hypothetical protein
VFLLLRDLTAGITRLGADAASDDPGGTMMEKLARGQYVAYRSPAYNRALDIFRKTSPRLQPMPEILTFP